MLLTGKIWETGMLESCRPREQLGKKAGEQRSRGKVAGNVNMVKCVRSKPGGLEAPLRDGAYG